MYQRILVPYDGSPTSRRGLDEAIRLARLMGSTLRVMHVVNEPLMALGVEGFAIDAAAILETMEEAGRELAKAAVDTVRAAGVACDSEVATSLQGRVCDLVVATARKWPADLIVIGTHGRRGVDRLMLGSDAEQILRIAPVPVLLARGQEAGVAVT
jgi:nucleotide-binding universal stress UspA family protein